jgi:hypothetical protein
MARNEDSCGDQVPCGGSRAQDLTLSLSSVGASCLRFPTAPALLTPSFDKLRHDPILSVSVSHNNASTAVTEGDGDLYRLLFIADLFGGKVTHEHCLASQGEPLF